MPAMCLLSEKSSNRAENVLRERKGKERKGKERKGKERKGKELSSHMQITDKRKHQGVKRGKDWLGVF